jgi:hypothetical protein
MSHLHSIVPRLLCSNNAEPKKLGHLGTATTKAGLNHGGSEKWLSRSAPRCLHISALLIGQRLHPQISVPDWLMVQAPPYSSLSDRRPVGSLTAEHKWQVPLTDLPSPGFLPLIRPGQALGLIAFSRTSPDVPEQTPASYHISVTSYAVIWNHYFYQVCGAVGMDQVVKYLPGKKSLYYHNLTRY